MQGLATVNADGSGSLTIDDEAPQQVATDTMDEARRELLRLVIFRARDTGRAIDITASDPFAQHRLRVHPDGTVRPISEPVAPTSAPAPYVPTLEAMTGNGSAVVSAPTPLPTPPDHEGAARWRPPAAPGTVQGGQPVPEPAPSPREVSFLSTTAAPPPVLHGWQAWLARLGIKSGPSAEDIAKWEDERAIAQHWPGPRTIAVLNGKGGSGKTPSTALLSAMFARAGGSGVLAWDTNVTRGTLGWRTETGNHDASVLDMLPHTQDLLTPNARAADLAAYVHHQRHDMYDVLRSNPLLLSIEQQLTPDQLDAVQAVAAKYYRLIFMDSGNDEGAPIWLRMIDHADQIVVATTTRPDHAEAGRLLLNALTERDDHSAQLAERAVVIVSQADREEAKAAEIARGFEPIARQVVTIPYDPAMRAQWLRVEALAQSTQRAYLRAAAAVAAGL